MSWGLSEIAKHQQRNQIANTPMKQFLGILVIFGSDFASPMVGSTLRRSHLSSTTTT
jgi:hypothetical protein